mgnify:CR=1 FL=1
MAENKEYMIHQEDDGSIQISEDVLASIASTTALEVDGVSALMSANVSDLMGGKKMTCKGVRVELDGEHLLFSLFLHKNFSRMHARAARVLSKSW